MDQVVARYYDATIGRFISPDTIVQDPYNPQCLNRYSYCLNNPLKFIDPSGHFLPPPGTDFDWSCWDPPGGGGGGSSGGGDEPTGSDDPAVGILEDSGSEWDNSAITSAVVMSGIILVDPIPGDEIALPPLWLIAGGAAVVMNGEYIGDKIVDGLSSLADKLTFWSSDSSDDMDVDESKGRSTGEKIGDKEANPENWVPDGEPDTEPATGRDYSGGISVEQDWVNVDTGETLAEHTIYGPGGQVKHHHYRD